MNTQKDYQLNYLSADFYEKYNTADYPEIENKNNRLFIIRQFRKFVSDYTKYATGKNTYYAAKKFMYSTLKYFHKELGID